jgi:signal peptidase II
VARYSRQVDLWIALAIVVLDQIVKAIIRREIALNESITVIPGFFDLTRVHNTGTAFGFMNATDFPFKTIILACIAIGALVALAMYAATLPANQWLARIGLALILGGAAGNLIDRIAEGYVVDFVDLYWSGWHFWAFNVADASITVGVGLMILDLVGAGSRHVSRVV